jgi:hypothetical protein
LNIPALGPSQPCQFLPESPNVRLRFRVTFRVGHQDANPPHLTGLLPPRRERPRSRRSSNSCDEIASSHRRLPQARDHAKICSQLKLSKQKFAITETGFKVIFAQQQSETADVAHGSWSCKNALVGAIDASPFRRDVFSEFGSFSV